MWKGVALIRGWYFFKSWHLLEEIRNSNVRLLEMIFASPEAKLSPHAHSIYWKFFIPHIFHHYNRIFSKIFHFQVIFVNMYIILLFPLKFIMQQTFSNTIPSKPDWANVQPISTWKGKDIFFIFSTCVFGRMFNDSTAFVNNWHPISFYHFFSSSIQVSKSSPILCSQIFL